MKDHIPMIIGIAILVGIGVLLFTLRYRIYTECRAHGFSVMYCLSGR